MDHESDQRILEGGSSRVARFTRQPASKMDVPPIKIFFSPLVFKKMVFFQSPSQVVVVLNLFFLFRSPHSFGEKNRKNTEVDIITRELFHKKIRKKQGDQRTVLCGCTNDVHHPLAAPYRPGFRVLSLSLLQRKS